MNAMQTPPDAPVILAVEDLKVHFPITRGVLRRTVGHVKAVDGVSFEVRQAETLGLVGESGCGKTTTGRALMRIVEPTGGEIRFRRPGGDVVDVRRAGRAELRDIRRDMRMVFQDPNSSLNPRLPVGEIIGEPLKFSGVAAAEVEERVVSLLRRVGLRPEYLRRYPHAFSGGERQRIGIARALAVNPAFVVCDEAVSASTSRSGAGAEALARAKRELDSPISSSATTSPSSSICDRVAVMYAGRLVEIGPTRQLYAAPGTLYRGAALGRPPAPIRACADRPPHPPDRRRGRPHNLPPGCASIRAALRRRPLRTETPALRLLGDRSVACHHARPGLAGTGSSRHRPASHPPSGERDALVDLAGGRRQQAFGISLEIGQPLLLIGGAVRLPSERDELVADMAGPDLGERRGRDRSR